MPTCQKVRDNGRRCGYIAKNGQALAGHLKTHNKAPVRDLQERVSQIEVRLGIRKAAPPQAVLDEDVSIEED